MNFRKVAALGMSAALIASLAACGNKSNNEPTTKQEEKTTVSSGETTSAGDNKTTSGETKDVKLLVWGPSEDQSTDKGQWLQTMCEQFNTDHPEWNITFEYGVCPEGDAGTVVSQDPTAAGDVYLYANDQIGTLVSANALAKLGGSAAEAVKSQNSQTLVDSVTYNDSIYGFPFTGNTWFMYYDKSKITDDEAKSLDAMLEKTKVSFPLSNSWYVQAFYVANGCTLFGSDGTDAAAGIDFGGDKAVAVTNYLVDLVANPNFVNDADGAGIAGLRDGSIGVIFSGSWDYDNVKEILGDNIGVTSLPTIKLDGKDVTLKSFAGSKVVGVNPNCKDPEVAIALAQYLSSKDAQKSHYELRSVIPSNVELLQDATIQADILVKAQGDTLASTSIVQPFIPEMNNYWTPAENFGKSLINKEVTHDNAAQKTEEFNTSLNTTLN